MLDDSVYYATRCLGIGNNRISQFKNQKSRYSEKKCKIDATKIVTLDDNSYLVPSERIEGKTVCGEYGLAPLSMPCWNVTRVPADTKQLVADHFNLVCADVIPDQDPRVRAPYQLFSDR